MDNGSLDGGYSPKRVTVVISRNTKPGHEKDYDDRLEHYLVSLRKLPGYRGTTIIVPGNSNPTVRYIIGRFIDNSNYVIL